MAAYGMLIAVCFVGLITALFFRTVGASPNIPAGQAFGNANKSLIDPGSIDGAVPMDCPGGAAPQGPQCGSDPSWHCCTAGAICCSGQCYKPGASCCGDTACGPDAPCCGGRVCFKQQAYSSWCYDSEQICEKNCASCSTLQQQASCQNCCHGLLNSCLDTCNSCTYPQTFGGCNCQ